MTTLAPVANRLKKGDYAVAIMRRSATSADFKTNSHKRLYIIRVESADREGRVKTFVNNPITSAATRNDSHVQILTLPPEYLTAAAKLFAQQELDFIGYINKEHLRLCLVNQQITEL